MMLSGHANFQEALRSMRRVITLNKDDNFSKIWRKQFFVCLFCFWVSIHWKKLLIEKGRDVVIVLTPVYLCQQVVALVSGSRSVG